MSAGVQFCFHLGVRWILFVATMLITLVGVCGSGLAAERSVVLATPLNTIDTVISEVVLREAYGRIGLNVEIQKYPGERALRLADRGAVDGEVQRIDGLDRKYANLVQIYPPTNFIEGGVFTTGTVFDVDGWESLRPYRIGITRGIKFAEENTRGMDVYSAGNYEELFQMLVRGRVDVIVSPSMNGRYQMNLMGLSGIRLLEPAVARFELFHYLHKDRADLASRITPVLEVMERDGTLSAIRKHVVAVLMARAKLGLPVCDDDYACFEQ